MSRFDVWGLVFVGFINGFAMGACAASPHAHAADIAKSINICAELRSGTTLAVIESQLLARGYTDSDAGAYTGKTVLEHCPDQKANVIAQLRGIR